MESDTVFIFPPFKLATSELEDQRIYFTVLEMGILAACE